VGLSEDAIYQGADVWATTDYRTIFSEMLFKRLHNNKLLEIFPGYTAEEYQPLGIFSGLVPRPIDILTSKVFFESELSRASIELLMKKKQRMGLR
jgi:hypothetical protein